MSSILLSWIWQIRVPEADLSLSSIWIFVLRHVHWLPFNILYFWVSVFFNEPTFTVVRLLLHIHSDEWVLQASAAEPNGVHLFFKSWPVDLIGHMWALWVVTYILYLKLLLSRPRKSDGRDLLAGSCCLPISSSLDCLFDMLQVVLADWGCSQHHSMSYRWFYIEGLTLLDIHFALNISATIFWP